MKLSFTVKEFVEGMEKMTETCKKQFGAMLLDEECLTGEQFELFQSMFGMIDVSTRLVRDQANTIQEINDKLDKLLEKSEEKES